MTVEDLLPTKYREKAAEYEKGTDTMDVWFDSGGEMFCYETIGLINSSAALLQFLVEGL